MTAWRTELQAGPLVSACLLVTISLSVAYRASVNAQLESLRSKLAIKEKELTSTLIRANKAEGSAEPSPAPKAAKKSLFGGARKPKPKPAPAAAAPAEGELDLAIQELPGAVGDDANPWSKAEVKTGEFLSELEFRYNTFLKDWAEFRKKLLED